jgi:hypothetical protein
MQVVYGVGALCRIAIARKGHFRVLGKGLGIGQKEVEIGVGPVTAFGFEGLGIFEALDRAPCAANHTEKRGTDMGRPAPFSKLWQDWQGMSSAWPLFSSAAASLCSIGRAATTAGRVLPLRRRGLCRYRNDIAGFGQFEAGENPARHDTQPYGKGQRDAPPILFGSKETNAASFFSRNLARRSRLAIGCAYWHRFVKSPRNSGLERPVWREIRKLLIGRPARGLDSRLWHSPGDCGHAQGALHRRPAFFTRNSLKDWWGLPQLGFWHL